MVITDALAVGVLFKNYIQNVNDGRRIGSGQWIPGCWSNDRRTCCFRWLRQSSDWEIFWPIRFGDEIVMSLCWTYPLGPTIECGLGRCLNIIYYFGEDERIRYVYHTGTMVDFEIFYSNATTKRNKEFWLVEISHQVSHLVYPFRDLQNPDSVRVSVRPCKAQWLTFFVGLILALKGEIIYVLAYYCRSAHLWDPYFNNQSGSTLIMIHFN